MTAGPFVTTVTKESSPSARVTWGVTWRRVMMSCAALVTLLMALATIVYVIRPKCHLLHHHHDAPLSEQSLASLCALPADPGQCRGAYSKYYYDVMSQQCRHFLFGGCDDGNANRFDTKEMCEAHCVAEAMTGHQTRDMNICQQPLMSGDCRASMPRYGFSIDQQKCVSFTYGGCGNNGNNFVTLQHCQEACPSASGVAAVAVKQPPKDCTSPADTGNCMAYLERYTFDVATQRCVKFVFGGCGGNGNQYESEDECRQACTSPPADLVRGKDYDVKECELDECPADCGLVARDDNCVYCNCSNSPFVNEGEVLVRKDEQCPTGYTKIREDFAADVCAKTPVPSK